MNQSDVIDSFKPDFARKHGCAWFVWNDENQDPNQTGGWASIGGEVAFQFTRAKDLPKDVVWWTNLTKPQAWTLGRWSHFKHGGFLGPEWLTLMSEWGFPHDLEQFKKSCSLWSETLARVSEWLSRFTTRTIEEGAPVPHWAWGDGDFCEALAERLSWQQSNQHHHVALTQAYLEMVPQEWPQNALQGKRKLALVLPRRPHAHKVYTTRFPKGSFQEVIPAELPQEKDKRWAWIAKSTRPLLVRIDEILFKPGQEQLGALWWGRRGQSFSGSMMEPIWLTGEEALEMSQYIDAYPEALLQAQGWETLPSVPFWVDLQEDPLLDNSIVTGILCESLWRAAATPVRTATKRIKSSVSPQMIWLRAADKRECFQKARMLQAKGLTILSYGEGVVNVAFDPQVTLIADWEEMLNVTSLRTPLTIAEPLSIPVGFTSQSIDRWLKKEGALEEFVMLDRLLVPWLGPQKSLLKGVLEQAMRALAGLKAPSDDFSQTWKKELKNKTKQAVSSLTSTP